MRRASGPDSHSSWEADAIAFPEIRWTGKPDDSRTDLGFPVVAAIQTTTLYEAQRASGTYSHHAHITSFRGTLFATWSNGRQDEDAAGQRALLRRSSDRGRTWTECAELFPPLSHEVRGKVFSVLCDNGFAKVDGTLYAIAEGYDGLGRMARSVAPDGSLGPIFWLHAEPRKPAGDAVAYSGSDHPEFREQAAWINAYLARPEHFPTWDCMYHKTRCVAADGHNLCEPTRAWKLRDGTWTRLWRDLDKSFRNYASFSTDDGSTWSKPVPTGFPDACSRANVGTLPDGLVYVISNVRCGGDEGIPGRDPLAISLSADGTVFDRVGIIRHGAPPKRFAGRWKAIGFQYPASVVLDDDLLAIYSVNKEDIELARLPFSALQDIPPSKE